MSRFSSDDAAALRNETACVAEPRRGEKGDTESMQACPRLESCGWVGRDPLAQRLRKRPIHASMRAVEVKRDFGARGDRHATPGEAEEADGRVGACRAWKEGSVRGRCGGTEGNDLGRRQGGIERAGRHCEARSGLMPAVRVLPGGNGARVGAPGCEAVPSCERGILLERQEQQ